MNNPDEQCVTAKHAAIRRSTQLDLGFFELAMEYPVVAAGVAVQVVRTCGCPVARDRAGRWPVVLRPGRGQGCHACPTRGAGIGEHVGRRLRCREVRRLVDDEHTTIIDVGRAMQPVLTARRAKGRHISPLSAHLSQYPICTRARRADRGVVPAHEDGPVIDADRVVLALVAGVNRRGLCPALGAAFEDEDVTRRVEEVDDGTGGSMRSKTARLPSRNKLPRPSMRTPV